MSIDWLNEIRKFATENPHVVLVGNKSDLVDKYQRAVSAEEASRFAEANGMAYYEVSAKTGNGIENMFNQLVVGVVQRRIANNKMIAAGAEQDKKKELKLKAKAEKQSCNCVIL